MPRILGQLVGDIDAAGPSSDEPVKVAAATPELQRGNPSV